MKSLVLLLWCIAMHLSAATPVPSTLFTARDGLPNAGAKLKRGEELRVVFVGGSITQGGGADGYVAATEAWLKTQWPGARIRVFNAGISGTDSAFGAKRYDRDVLVHKPDLVLIEFAVNDGDRDHTAHMERMVHKTWLQNPECDVAFFYTLSKGHLEDYKAGKLPRGAAFHERVAEHYGIPSIGLAHAVAAKVNAGEIEWKQFANDAVHPHAAGYRLFNEALQAVLPQLLAGGVERAHALKEPMTPGLQVYPPALEVAPLDLPPFVTAKGERSLAAFAAPVPALHWIENNAYANTDGKTLWRLQWLDKKRSAAMDETIGLTKAEWAQNPGIWFAEDKSFTGPEGNALYSANARGITLGFSGKEVAVLVFVAPETGRYAFRVGADLLTAWQNEETEFALHVAHFAWGEEKGRSLWLHRAKRREVVPFTHEAEIELVAGEELIVLAGSNTPGFIRGGWENFRLQIGYFGK